jgi:SAM-dependent methyltransferase
MAADREYFDYLRKRRLMGLLYRKLWLYPRLRRQLTGRVLDVGCGIGDFLSTHPGSIGVDINPLLVEWCRNRGLNASVMAIDKIPFGSGSFESVVLDNVLEHVAHPAPLLAEIRRVLVPGGVFLVGVPGRRGYRADPDHKVFYDEATLTRTLEGAGFAFERMLHMPVRSAWLNAHMRQYCLYAVHRRST